jgi:hypothetical protein
MYTEISLHDYRLSYPKTAPIPTITQRGLIGSLLELQRRKAIRATRRKAVRKYLLAMPVKALAWIWRILNTSTVSANESFAEAAAKHV